MFITTNNNPTNPVPVSDTNNPATPCLIPFDLPGSVGVWTTMITGWDASGYFIDIAGWARLGGKNACPGQTPRGPLTPDTDYGSVQVFYVNPSMNLFGMNVVMELAGPNNHGWSTSGIGIEVDVVNDTYIDLEGTVGFSAQGLGPEGSPHRSGVGYVTAGSWFRGFECGEALVSGFSYGSTPGAGGYGFFSQQATGFPFLHQTDGLTRFLVSAGGDGFAYGQWAGGRIGARGAPSSVDWKDAGCYLGWNFSGGLGEAVLINSKGGGVGGFRFYNVASNTTDTPVQIMGIDSSGHLSVTTGSAVGLWSVARLTLGGTPTSSDWSIQGAHIGWNVMGGSGETDFINSRGLGAGGFAFYNVDTSPTASPVSLMTLDSSATLKVSSGVSAPFLAGDMLSLGSLGTTTSPAIDFHSATGSQGFDVRLISAGGTSGVAGQGELTIASSRVVILGMPTNPAGLPVGTLWRDASSNQVFIVS